MGQGCVEERHTVLKQLSQYRPTHCRHFRVADLIPHSSHFSCSAEDSAGTQHVQAQRGREMLAEWLCSD